MHAAARVLLWIVVSLVVLLLAAVVFLRLFDWSVLKDEIAAQLSERLEREVVIRGPIDLDLDLRSIKGQAGGIRVASTLPSPEPFFALEQIAFQLQLRPLLAGTVVFDHVTLIEPRLSLVRNEKGEVNWKFKPTGEEVPLVPVIERFEVRGGGAVYRDAALDEPVELAIERIEGALDREGTLSAGGVGEMDSQNVQLRARAESIDDGENWRIDTALMLGDARLTVAGTLARPDLRIDLSVPRPAQLEFLPLPDLPDTGPITFTSRLTYDQDQGHWWLDKLELRAAEHRLEGDLRIDAEQVPPMFYANLYLPELVLPDVEAEKLERRKELIPAVPIDTTPLKQMNLDAKLRIGEIKNGPVPLGDARLAVNLRDARLAINIVSARVARGRVDGNLVLDGSQSVPTASVKISLQGLRQPPLIPEDAVTGAFSGRIDLRGRGKTLEDLVRTADGQLLFTVRQGAIPRAWAAAVALDVATYLFAGDPEADQTPVRCAFVALEAENGVLRARPVVIDTEDFLIVLDGTIDLGAEQLDLALSAYPKEFSPLAFQGPIEVNGPLLEPSVDLPVEEIAGRGAAALALGALAAPLAGLLPLMDPGVAEDQNCRRLLADALPPAKAPARN